MDYSALNGMNFNDAVRAGLITEEQTWDPEYNRMIGSGIYRLADGTQVSYDNNTGGVVPSAYAMNSNTGGYYEGYDPNAQVVTGYQGGSWGPRKWKTGTQTGQWSWAPPKDTGFMDSTVFGSTPFKLAALTVGGLNLAGNYGYGPMANGGTVGELTGGYNPNLYAANTVGGTMTDAPVYDTVARSAPNLAEGLGVGLEDAAVTGGGSISPLAAGAAGATGAAALAKAFSPYATPAAVIGGSLISANSAGKAADIQAAAADKAIAAQTAATNAAIDEQRRQFDLNRSDLAPYREAGTSALGTLKSLLDSGSLTRKFTLDDFWSDPVTKASYKAGLDLGTASINNMARSRGNLNSGATLKALDRFGTDYTGNQAAASQARFVGDQANTFNKYSTVAGIGQSATNTGANLGTQAATNIGNIGTTGATNVANLVTGAGNARGASAIGQGNAIGGALNTLGGWWGQQQLLDQILQARNNTAPPAG